MASIFESADYEVNPTFEFWTEIDEFALQDVQENQIKKGILMILSPSGRLRHKTAVLTTARIYLLKKKSPSKMAQVTWKKLEAFCETNENQELFGFRLAQRGIFQDFYTDNSEDLEVWLDSLSRVTLMSDLEDEYKLVRELGNGNYGKVFLAKDIQNQKEFAVKSISKEAILVSARSTAALISEISVMRKLDHPYLIKLHRVYENNEFVHLVLDYLPGGDLFRRIVDRSVFTEETSAKFMKNLLEALDYMHSHNIIHRDLKPENILMTSPTIDHEFKIADFGLACECKEDLLARCGSPGYVAPEILRKRRYGPKVDLFSAGIVLYALLSSRAPFFGKTSNEVLVRNKECKIYFQDKYWKDVSKEGIDFVLRLTDSHPESRPTAREALKHPWLVTAFKKRGKIKGLEGKDGRESGISAELMRRMNQARGVAKGNEGDGGGDEKRKVLNQNAKDLLSKLRGMDTMARE